MKHPKSARRAAEPPSEPPDRFTSLGKGDLIHLTDELLSCEPSVVSICVEFIEAETEGLWHGRARAKMCRRLKHCSLTSSESERLVTCITNRLRSGHFSQQFRDQLRLALRLDTERVFAVARDCARDPRPYVRRYCDWLLKHPSEATGNA